MVIASKESVFDVWHEMAQDMTLVSAQLWAQGLCVISVRKSFFLKLVAAGFVAAEREVKDARNEGFRTLYLRAVNMVGGEVKEREACVCDRCIKRDWDLAVSIHGHLMAMSFGNSCRRLGVNCSAGVTYDVVSLTVVADFLLMLADAGRDGSLGSLYAAACEGQKVQLDSTPFALRGSAAFIMLAYGHALDHVRNLIPETIRPYTTFVIDSKQS